MALEACHYGASNSHIMNYLELIKYLIEPEQLDKLYRMMEVNVESEALLVYMKESLDINAEVEIFEIEETDDDLVIERNGVSYVQLFPVDYIIELIQSDLKLNNKSYSEIEIASKILDYRLRDA
jgi:hypothetical protein